MLHFLNVSGVAGVSLNKNLRFIKKDQPYYFDLLVDEEGLEKE